jgi:hypothetical protein
MQSDIEVLLKLLVSDEKARNRYLPASVSGRGFDIGGLFIPENGAQVVFFIGQLVAADAARDWSEKDRRSAQKLASLLWLVSESGGNTLPDAILRAEEGLLSHYDGIRAVIREIAQVLVVSRAFDDEPINRGFDEVFMKDSFPLDSSLV